MCRMFIDVSFGSGLHNPAFLFVSVAVSVYYKEKFVSLMESEEYTYL